MFCEIWLGFAGGDNSLQAPCPAFIFDKKSLSPDTVGWGQVNLWPTSDHHPSLHILNVSHSIWNFSGIWF